MLFASTTEDISWYENDGTGIFAPRQFVTMAIFSAKSVYAADIDGDGDMDVLSASSGDNVIAWYENDGTGNFGALQTISTTANSPRSIYAADIYGDGDIDVLSASLYDDRIAWYENASNTLSVDANELNNELLVYPNPATNQITITNLALQKIEIYDLTGRLVKSVSTINNEETIRIDISSLHAASYLIKVITDKAVVTKKLIKT
nr:T9SS type A sorting domain-containing protein [Polaribacter sp. Hel1_85]